MACPRVQDYFPDREELKTAIRSGEVQRAYLIIGYADGPTWKTIVKLYSDKAPHAVYNFIRYASSVRYAFVIYFVV